MKSYRPILLALTVVALATSPSFAAVKSCTNARVTSGDCPSTSQTLVMFAIDTTVLAEAADEIADVYGWPVVVCSQADVDAARCTILQLGGRYTTAETKTNFANRKLGEMIRGYIVTRRLRLAAANATTATLLPGAIE